MLGWELVVVEVGLISCDHQQQLVILMIIDSFYYIGYYGGGGGGFLDGAIYGGGGEYEMPYLVASNCDDITLSIASYNFV